MLDWSMHKCFGASDAREGAARHATVPEDRGAEG
jgi:hypothetical protein